jgi:phosphatidylglycerol lysyltransferase
LPPDPAKPGSNPTGPWHRLRSRWLRRHLAGVTICAVAALAFWGVERATAGVSVQALMASLRATSTTTLLAALAATVVSYIALFGYDLSGLCYARARPPLSSALIASFCGYAIANAVGFGALSGGAVRYRIYSAAGLSTGQIARVVLFISVAIGVGLTTTVATGLVLCADRVGQILGTAPQPLRAAAAILLVLAMSFLVFLGTRRRPLAIGPLCLEPPGLILILGQIAVTTADMLAAAAVLWVLLPPTGIGFFVFAAVFAAALGLGVLSHVPGGLGVFELVILYIVGNKAPVAEVAAALVAYRGIYFLLPLSLSAVLLAVFEGRRLLRPTFRGSGRRLPAGIGSRRADL